MNFRHGCIIVLLSTVVALVTTPAVANDFCFVLGVSSLQRGQVNLGKVPWKYHAGDNPQWSKPALNDAAWTSLAPRFHIDSVPPGTWTGIGWFRLHFRVDSTMYRQTMALTNFYDGAAEVWMDGVMLRRWGVPGGNPAEEVLPTDYGNATFAVLSFPDRDTTEHVLAVRYSYWRWEIIAARWGWFFKDRLRDNIGFAPLLKELTLVQNTTPYTLKLVQYCLFLGFPASLAFLHWLLFFFYRSERSNVFLAAFATSAAALALSVLINFARLGLGLETIILLYGISGAIAFPAMHVFLLLALYSLFYGNIPHYSWWFIGCGMLLMASELTWGFSWRPFVPRVIFFGLIVVILAEILRVTMRAILQKRDGAWILGSGSIVFCLASATGEFYLHILRVMRPAALLPFILVPVYLALPVAMSLLVARRSARTNRMLQRHNLDLETEVLERTKDLRSANEEISRQMEIQTEQAREIELANNQLQEINGTLEELNRSITTEREKSEQLLMNVLPQPIAERMKAGEIHIAEHFSEVTVLFADIVGFTNLSSKINARELVNLLDGIFSGFDAAAVQHGVEKIKTIGDAYMAVCGAPVHYPDHVERVARFALEMLLSLESLHRQWLVEGKELSANPLQIRVGIHTGDVVAGVIGTQKFSYDLWGDTVNIASHLESHGEPGKIQVSEAVFQILHNTFLVEERGIIEIKGKGTMKTWFLTGERL